MPINQAIIMVSRDAHTPHRAASNDARMAGLRGHILQGRENRPYVE
jgi:hypothetical protein